MRLGVAGDKYLDLKSQFSNVTFQVDVPLESGAL